MTVGVNPVIVILAGGRATRMGGQDKALLPFGTTTLLDRVLDRMRPQGNQCVISANGDPARFARFGLPVIQDSIPGFPGPLAGVLAGMEWAAATATHIVTVPVDGPFVPTDLVTRLTTARDAANADIAYAISDGRAHPVYAVWPTRLAPELRAALNDDQRKVMAWAAKFRTALVEFQSESLLNLNTPEELKKGQGSALHPLRAEAPERDRCRRNRRKRESRDQTKV